MELEDLLDLLGEDLLASGVDAHRAAAQDPQRAVGVDGGVVAGHRVPRPVYRPKGPRRLLGILVVPDRIAATHGQETDLARAGGDVPSVVADDPGVAAEDEACRLG